MREDGGALYAGRVEASDWFGSLFDFRRKGLFEKKPERFFCTDFSGESMPGSSTPPTGACLVGEFLPDVGSALVKELVLEYSL